MWSWMRRWILMRVKEWELCISSEWQRIRVIWKFWEGNLICSLSAFLRDQLGNWESCAPPSTKKSFIFQRFLINLRIRLSHTPPHQLPILSIWKPKNTFVNSKSRLENGVWNGKPEFFVIFNCNVVVLFASTTLMSYKLYSFVISPP